MLEKDDLPLTILTPVQAETLRYVLDRRTSKEIGRLMNVSPHTVDERLRVIIRKLGVANRIDAARLWESYGNFTYVAPYQPLTYQSIGLEDQQDVRNDNLGRDGDGMDGKLPDAPRTDRFNGSGHHKWKTWLFWGGLLLSSAIITFMAIQFLLVNLGRNLD